MAENGEPRKKPITLDKLKSMSPDARARLYERARQKKDEGGQEIMDLIDGEGLSMSEGNLTQDSPDYLIMADIAWSRKGKAKLVAATEQGLPALAGIESMIRERLGERYHPHDQGTNAAGRIVGEVMRHLGYEKIGQIPMPAGSVAQSATRWKPRN